MMITTKFSPRDKAWCLDFQYEGVHQLTVGQVRFTYTDSDGREGEETFDNYMPQSGTSEEYMCVESGIGCGTVFKLGVSIFETREEAENALAQLIADRNIT